MKEVKFYKVRGDSISYPVGPGIMHNKKSIAALTDRMVKIIGKNTPITLWCRGSSGAIIAAITSLSFDKVYINHVKKHGEEAHSYSYYNGTINSRIQIIIDDFSNSGDTVNEVRKEMEASGIKKIDYVCLGGSCRPSTFDFIPNIAIIGTKVISKDHQKIVQRTQIFKYE